MKENSYFQVGRPPKEEVGKDKEKKKSKKGSGNNKEEKVKLSATPLMNMPQEIIDMPVDPNEPTYCVCQQGNLFTILPFQRENLHILCEMFQFQFQCLMER